MDAPIRTFRAGRSDRDEAWLRRLAALVTSLGAGLFALARPGPLSVVVSLTVIAASFAWQRRANAALTRAGSEASLVLDEDGLERRQSSDATRIAWSDVSRIELDEDLLVVRVVRDGADDLVIEPIYEGASVYDLAEAVSAAHRAAKERRALPAV